MHVNYRKRQNTARLLCTIAWFALAACTRLWGCAPSSTNDATGQVIKEASLPSSHRSADAGASDSGMEDGGMPNDWIFKEPTNDKETEYLLLLGFDKNTKLPGRTDSIMIVAARHKTSDIGVLSIPRDLWVNIPGEEPGRINKVYRVGNMRNGKGGGHKLLVEVIKTELGISIDYTAAVNFGGFEGIVDSLGGIQVDVECPIQDNFMSPASKTGYESFKVNAGRQKMNGKTALLFSRSRHGRTDLDRARRQQAVLLGLKRRISSPDVLLRFPTLWESLKGNVATDIDLMGALRLARLAAKADSGMIHGLVIRAPMVFQWRSPEGKSVLRLNRKLFEKSMNTLFTAPSPGARTKPVCRPADAALNWKELRKKKLEKQKTKEKCEAIKQRHDESDRTDGHAK